MKKIILLVSAAFLLPLVLPAQNAVDKKAATLDILRGFEDEFKDVENNKKYLSPNLKVVWPGGNSWPDGTGKDTEGFWEFYSTRRAFFKSEMSDIAVREADNETYLFATWKSTIRKHEEDPELVGISAVGPIAYRMIWENDQIKEWHIFFDFKSREEQEQHAKGKD